MRAGELDEMLKNRMDAISVRVRSEREGRNWDVTELVIRSRVNQQTIYNIENGNAENITLKSLIGIARAFEMELPMLLA